jgi:riboflavin kinase/FMN adenylyltransferase
MNRNAIAIGIFDGVHRGHKAVFRDVLRISEKMRLSPCAMTFSGSSKSGDRLILTESERTERIKACGINTIFNLRFDEIKDLSPDEFTELLQSEYEAAHIAVGEDFRYGKERSGDLLTLKKSCDELGIGLTVTSEILHNNEKISSGKIRQLLEAGEIEYADELLGYDFFVSSEVIHGQELARTLGFPTVNQQYPPEKVKIKQGVYITDAEFDGKRFQGITDYGIKPTVNYTGAPLLETYIHGFDGDLYGKEITVFPKRFLREEIKFNNIDELKAQMQKDIENLG